MLRIIAVSDYPKIASLNGNCQMDDRNSPVKARELATIWALVPTLAKYEPFVGMYSSRALWATGAASVLAKAFEMDFQTVGQLGQYVNNEGETVPFRPGYKVEDGAAWQENGVETFKDLADGYFVGQHGEDCEASILVVSHHHLIGGVVAHCCGMTSTVKVNAIVNDPRTIGKGFRVFEITPNGNVKLSG